MKEDTKAPSACFSSAPSWRILAFSHPQEARKGSLTGNGAEEEKQHLFLEGFAYSPSPDHMSAITVACG